MYFFVENDYFPADMMKQNLRIEIFSKEFSELRDKENFSKHTLDEIFLRMQFCITYT